MNDFKKDPLDLLRKKQPSDLQLHRWKVAVKMQFPASGSFSVSHLLQLTAAASIGLVLGALIFGQGLKSQPQEIIQNAYDDATMEVVYTKLD